MPAKNIITILFIGDIVGRPGRKAVTAILPELKKQYQQDITIANAENIAHGVGITPKTLAECQAAGIDFFTSGNHIFKKSDVQTILADPDAPLIRPANYEQHKSGQGHKLMRIGKKSLLVINLNGQVFMESSFTNPFHTFDEILSQYDIEKIGGILVDFHAEATSEKVAFGWYVDGRVAALLGTHTHIPTADEKILPRGTAYITDVGMVGLAESVLGVDKDIIIHNFRNPIDRTAHDIPSTGRCGLNAVLLNINTTTHHAEEMKRIYREVVV